MTSQKPGRCRRERLHPFHHGKPCEGKWLQVTGSIQSQGRKPGPPVSGEPCQHPVGTCPGTQKGAATAHVDWRCTWWPCRAPTPAPRCCGSSQPSPAPACSPGEEDRRESQGTKERDLHDTAGVSGWALLTPGAWPQMPSPMLHAPGTAGPSYSFAWKCSIKLRKFF